MEKSLKPPIIKKFNCSVCNKEAGTITLTFTSLGVEYPVEGFIMQLWVRLEQNELTKFREALEGQNVPALFALDFESMPFYCAKCNASYCKEHWNYWLVCDDELRHMIDSTRRQCPKGHKRMLLD